MSTSRIGPAPRWAIVASGILVLLGVAVASYLTYSHYSASTLAACPDTGLINCQKVTSSAQSKILGIPVAVLGLAYFISAIAFYNPIAWNSARRWVHIVRLVMAVSAMCFVLWLVYAELIIIGNICEYCTGVHVITFALFVITLIAVPPMLAAPAQPADELEEQDASH